MTLWNLGLVLSSWRFASKVHKDQRVPGTELAYINHIGTVTMEAMAALFGHEVARGVLSL